MSHPHTDHVQAHLERVRYGHLVDPSPDTVFLGAEEEDHFWELLGLRIAGCPVVVLALLRFQRLDLPGIPYARESLASYLSELPALRSVDEAGALSAILPPHDQSIPFFLRRLRSGLRYRPVSLDPARIQVAFDFRLQNPMLVADFRAGAPPLVDHYYRTVDGHVLRGRSHEVPPTAPRDHPRFVTVTSAEQVTPTAVWPLPALALNRGYLALRAQAATRDEMAAVRGWMPFLPAVASSRGVLPLPASRAPEPKASSLVGTSGMPMAWATSSSSRMAIHARPGRESFKRVDTNTARRQPARTR